MNDEDDGSPILDEDGVPYLYRRNRMERFKDCLAGNYLGIVAILIVFSIFVCQVISLTTRIRDVKPTTLLHLKPIEKLDNDDYCDFGEWPNVKDCNGFVSKGNVSYLYPPRAKERARRSFQLTEASPAGDGCAGKSCTLGLQIRRSPYGDNVTLGIVAQCGDELCGISIPAYAAEGRTCYLLCDLVSGILSPEFIGPYRQIVSLIKYTAAFGWSYTDIRDNVWFRLNGEPRLGTCPLGAPIICKD
jgi:hypothetical protein